MPPFLALLLWFALLLGLLYCDPARDRDTAPALWVPVIWMFFIGSRLPAQWLGGYRGSAAQAFEEGSPLDRAVFTGLILLAICILISRSFKWSKFFTQNVALMAFLFFALVSILWSDFPFVSFKRWFRDLGNYLVILVVLSDSRPLEALRTLLRRLCYLLIPLSILIYKYYPQIGKQYDSWTGAAAFVGATTSKNMLGAVCLISGLFFLWDTVARWSNRTERRTGRIIKVNFAFMAMTLWLLVLSNSATSRVCLLIGCLIILAAHSGIFRRHPTFLKVLVPAGFWLYLILAFGFGINGVLAGAVGRDPTLTDRTIIWNTVLNIHTNPLIGTGYESFWLGPRLQQVWKKTPGINESHNGYLEVYLNLGLIGVFLIIGLLISSYRKICRRLTPFSSIASFYLALWAIMLFYNMTEAAFKGGFMWATFLLAAIAVPERAADHVRGVAPFNNAGATGRVPGLPFETALQRR